MRRFVALLDQLAPWALAFALGFWVALALVFALMRGSGVGYLVG